MFGVSAVRRVGGGADQGQLRAGWGGVAGDSSGGLVPRAARRATGGAPCAGRRRRRSFGRRGCLEVGADVPQSLEPQSLVQSRHLQKNTRYYTVAN